MILHLCFIELFYVLQVEVVAVVAEVSVSLCLFIVSTGP